MKVIPKLYMYNELPESADGTKNWEKVEVKNDASTVYPFRRVDNNTIAVDGNLQVEGDLSGATWTAITDKPTTFPPSTHTHPWSQVTNKPPLFDNSIFLGTTSLNSITTPGVYHQHTNADATTARNYPVAYAGTLIVSIAAGIIQEYICYGPYTQNRYTRGYYVGTWSPWVRVNDWNTLSSKPSTFAPSSHSHNSLDTNFRADLDSVTATGVYRQETPSSGYNYTTTLNMNSADGRQQLTIARDGSGMKFRGVNSGSGTSGWTSWKEVYHTGNMPTTATRWPTWTEVTGKPTTFEPSSHTHTASQISGLPTGATNMTSNRVQFGNIKICWGRVRITTKANERASLDVTLPFSYTSADTMNVQLTIEGGNPQRADVGALRTGTNSIKIWLYRTTADWNDINWFVVGT